MKEILYRAKNSLFPSVAHFALLLDYSAGRIARGLWWRVGLPESCVG
jgi:hypothetical protein